MTLLFINFLFIYFFLIINFRFSLKINKFIFLRRSADVDGDGTVSEAEFIVFKLQQLEVVDQHLIDKLKKQYHSDKI